MGKEFQNIDQLAKEALSSMNEKAPAFIKTNLNNSIGSGFNKWGMVAILALIGASSLILFNQAEQSEGFLKRKVLSSNSFYSIDSQKNNTQEFTQHERGESNAPISNEDEYSNLTPTIISHQTIVALPLVQQNQYNISSENDGISKESTTDGPSEVLKPRVAIFQHPSQLNKNVSKVQNTEESTIITEDDELEKDKSTQQVDVFGLNYPELEIEKEHKQNSYWYAVVSSGLNFSKTFYTTNAASQENIYQKGTNSQLSNETVLDFVFRTKSALTLNTGIGIAQFKESYHYQTSLGEAVSGTNRANYGQFNIGLGTQINISKFKFDLFAQGRMNMLISGSGAFLEDDALINYSQNDKVLKKSFLNLALGTRIHYPIYKDLHLNATIRYTPVFGELTNNTPFTKKMQYTHAGIGISYFF